MVRQYSPSNDLHGHVFSSQITGISAWHQGPFAAAPDVSLGKHASDWFIKLPT